MFAAYALISFGLVVCWCLLWREVPVTVNGRQRIVRIATPIRDLLEQNAYFGAKPGKLLSIGGNVLSEDGGNSCSVTYGGAQLDPAQIASYRLHEGDELTVDDGKDVQEGHIETTVDVPPGIQMDRGGAVQFVSRWGKAGVKTVWTGRRSKEVIDRQITKLPVDMIVRSINLEPKADRPCVALTFDDGPSSFTPKVLDILAQKGVKATFFNLGANVMRDPAAARAITDAGCALGNHTMTHMNLTTVDRDTLRSEISRSADILRGTGASPQMIRAPYGAFTAAEWARSGDLIGSNILWNIDTRDWTRPGANKIAGAVLDGAKNGSIILMHDGGGDRSQDVQALPGIIDELHKRGFAFVTVPEMMKLDGRIPDAVVGGTTRLPDDCGMPDS